MFGQLAVSLALALAQPGPGFEERRRDITTANEDWQRARAAGEQGRALAAARRLVAAAPENPVLRTFLAVSAAEAGDQDLARETLEWLAARGYGVFDRGRARAAVNSVLEQPRHAKLAQRLAANAAPRGSAVAVRPVPAGVRSEGITYDSRRDRVYLANGDGLFAVRPDGGLDPVLRPDALKDRFVLGVRYDPARDRVFVCSSSPPDAPNPTAELVVLHPAQPERVERFALPPSPQQRLCNDIAVLPDGAALTDTNTGEVFRYRDGQGVSRLTEARFTYPNGIVQLGDRIVVADLLGLWALADDGRLLGEMRTADGEYLGGMDGLAAQGDTLVGVQNLIAPGRVVSFRAAGDLLLRDRRVLIAGAPELDGMTTAAIRGASVLVVSGRADAAGSPRRALVELRLPADAARRGGSRTAERRPVGRR